MDDVKKIIAGFGMALTDATAVEEFYRQSIALQKLDESENKLEQAAHGLKETFEIFEPMSLKENRASKRRQKFGSFASL